MPFLNPPFNTIYDSFIPLGPIAYNHGLKTVAKFSQQKAHSPLDEEWAFSAFYLSIAW